jgi:hypothetical protein
MPNFNSTSLSSLSLTCSRSRSLSTSRCSRLDSHAHKVLHTYLCGVTTGYCSGISWFFLQCFMYPAPLVQPFHCCPHSWNLIQFNKCVHPTCSHSQGNSNVGSCHLVGESCLPRSQCCGCELVGNLREGRVVSIPFSIHSARNDLTQF